MDLTRFDFQPNFAMIVRISNTTDLMVHWLPLDMCLVAVVTSLLNSSYCEFCVLEMCKQHRVILVILTTKLRNMLIYYGFSGNISKYIQQQQTEYMIRARAISEGQHQQTVRK